MQRITRSMTLQMPNQSDEVRKSQRNKAPTSIQIRRIKSYTPTTGIREGGGGEGREIEEGTTLQQQ